MSIRSRFSPTVHALYRSIRLVVRTAPSELRRLALINLAFGAGPAILLLLSKVVIDETALLLGDATAGSAVAQIWARPLLLWSIVGFVGVNILLDSIETISGFEFSSLRDRVQGILKFRIYQKIAEFEDISLFENPALLNIKQLAEQSIPRLQHLSAIIGNMLTGIFVFLPVLLLSLSIAWWIPLLIFVTAIPSIYTQMRYEERGWTVEYSQAAAVRRMGIYERVLTGEEFAKELRLFQLQRFMLDRWQNLFWPAFEELRGIRKQGALAVVGWSVVSGLGVGIPYLYVIVAAINGVYTLGDLALYAGLVFQVRRSLYILMGNVANLHEVALGSSAFFQLLDLQPAPVQERSDDTIVGSPTPNRDKAESAGLELRNVSFRYPGSTSKTLEGINLTVQPGEMVVIVGENGAGKTTLAKLLCRLYDPQEGVITWEGCDIRSIAMGTFRDNIAVLMQDYARFPATIRENIAFGLLAELNDDASIMHAAEGAGIKTMILGFPHGLETPLSKQLEDGLDVSGGQWQRIALARALMRHPRTKLIILDEPTAALDPKTEHEVFSVFRDMARDKIAVIISHRLALARVAHKVVVMDHGKIVEIGSHDELMAKGGPYYAMFTRQASSYVNT